MIPLRIHLHGFLCHRDRTEICFDDSSLWMLAGLNGSGKSAVFDAVTYALFGGHRGGQRNAEELINKESDGLIVELDFLRGDEVYRIKRTLKKQGRSTRQVLRRMSAEGNGKSAWQPIENTGNARGFDDWVRDTIGLTYETFTSSVLLMQGRAEKLLNADALDRRKVLAGIVDLERYENLHRRADEHRKKYKDKSEELEQKLALVAEVTEAELTEADGRIAAAGQGVEEVRAEVERRQRLRVQGERWADLRTKLARANEEWERGQGLLARAEAIERDWARLRLLRAVLPPLRTAVEQRERLAESEAKAAGLREEHDALRRQRDELDYAEKQAREKQVLLQQAVNADQQREQAIAGRLVELSGHLARVALCERHRQNLTALEADLAKLPADPAAALIGEQEACERLTALGQALPFLRRLHEERNQLAAAREAVRRAGEEEATVTAHGKELAAERKALAEQAEKATQKRQQADERAAAARALLAESRKQLQELSELEGAKVCRVCGQALTPGHLEAETARRERALAAAEGASQKTEKARKAALDEEKRLLERLKDLDARLQEARDQVKDWRARSRQAEQDAERHTRECGRIYADLAEPFRARVAPALPDDWPATTYPTVADLEEIGAQAQGLDAARRRLQDARAVFDQWNKLQGQRETARRLLAAQEAELPADVPALKHEDAELQREDAALKDRLKEHRSQLLAEQKGLERLEKQRHGLRDQAAERERRLEAERVRQEGCRETLARVRAGLPADWRERAETATPADLQAWQAEQAELEKQGSEGRAEELQQARERLEFLRQEKANRERELEEVPAEARCELDELDRRLLAAKRSQAEREAALGEARNARKALTDRQAQRQRLHEESLTVGGQYNRYRLLAELLGPKRLQLYLVRQAERGIVDYANEVLDRLSGGQLYLRLRGEEGEETAEKALELEAYNRTAGDAPIGVAFLSGSQRFRVAVSLALGIGQYASRQHRPIESVIIDEGFGCLDRQGRQVMIQELQNLRGHMRCILLVSHQEEFAEAFANGYKFELTNGTTEVTRFQR
jgi:DNA repair exonuclease SbcCD ATPase subunit